MATYASKRDWWLLAILWVSLGLMVIGLVSAFTEPISPGMRLFAACFFAFFIAFMAWLLILPYRTDYTLDPGRLTIRVGPFKHTIPLSEVTEVYPTHNPLSAPAWSMDRVRIRFSSSRFGALISPERQLQFMDEFEALAPHLVRKGDRLVLEKD
jgi:hypothetical protein